MNNDPLSQLRDIHTPDPVSWWPLAPGWWILIVLVIAAIVALVVWLNKRSRTTSQSQWINEQLQNLAQQTASQSSLVDALHLFRRIALVYWPKHIAANTPILMLAETVCQQHQLTLSESTRHLLGDAQYQPALSITQPEWQRFIRELTPLLAKIPVSHPIQTTQSRSASPPMKRQETNASMKRQETKHV